MSARPEFVGTIHIFRGLCRGNPIALYLRRDDDGYAIAPTMAPWNRVVGVGDTANKAAADFDAKWKAGEVAPELYSGPHWEGGIKPEKPKPPPKPPPASPPPTPASPVTASPAPSAQGGPASPESASGSSQTQPAG